jgi:Ca2+/Na+ antiporter
MVGGIGALVAVLLLLAEITSGHWELTHVIVLGVLAALLAATPSVLHVLHRAGTPIGEATRRSVAWLVLALFVLGLPIVDGGWSMTSLAEVPLFLLIAILAIWLTYQGLGSIALWAFRFAWVQLGALGTLMSRALPLLMLTVVVYYTGELWQLSARMSRERLWQTIGFLSLVAVVFVIATIRDEVRSLREDRSEQDHQASSLLQGTPLAHHITDEPAARTPLSRPEQFNVVAVMVIAQAIQVVFFTTLIFAFFLALGIIAVPDDVTVVWSGEESCPSGEPPCPGTWFGINVPLPQTLVQTSLFVAVLSGLYFTVNTSVDPQYRQRFFEPLIADLAVSLAGRDVYRTLERKS